MLSDNLSNHYQDFFILIIIKKLYCLKIRNIENNLGHSSITNSCSKLL